MAALCHAPAAMATTTSFLNARISVGTSRSRVSPWPRRPPSPLPHDQHPSAVSAMVCAAPHATSRTYLRSCNSDSTLVGTLTHSLAAFFSNPKRL